MSRETWVTGLGATALLCAVLVNEWTVRASLPPGVELGGLGRVALAALDLVLLVIGGALIAVRTNPRGQMRIVAVLGSTLFVFVLAELGLRLVGAGGEDFALRTIYTANPSGRGSFHVKPGLDISGRVAGQPYRIATNELGFRGAAPVADRGDRARIVCVGDSFTFGLYSSDADACFVGVMGERLATGAEVLNLGVPGYGLDDVLLQLEEVALGLDPDVVLLSIYAGNDFLDTYLGLGRYELSSAGAVDAAVEVIDERVPAEFRQRRAEDRVLRTAAEYSAILRSLRAAMAAIGAGQPPPAAAEGPRTEIPGVSSDEFWSLAEYPAFALAARDVTLARVGEIDELCRAAGARLMVTIVPYQHQVQQPGIFGEVLRIDRPQNFVMEAAEMRGIPALDLRAPLTRRFESDGQDLFIRSDGHFNDEGHRAAGELLAEWISLELAD